MVSADPSLGCKDLFVHSTFSGRTVLSEGRYGDCSGPQAINLAPCSSPIRGCTSGGVMYLVFTGMPGESYRRRLGSLLLCLCDGFQAPIDSFAC